MDDSVVQIGDDSSILEVSTDKEKQGKPPVAKPLKASGKAALGRKETRGGVKLDDTIELLSSDEDVKREGGDGASDIEEKADHFTTANDATSFR